MLTLFIPLLNITNLNMFVAFKTLPTNLIHNYKIVLPDKLQKI